MVRIVGLRLAVIHDCGMVMLMSRLVQVLMRHPGVSLSHFRLLAGVLAEGHSHRRDCRKRQPQGNKHNRKESQPTQHVFIVGEAFKDGKLIGGVD